MRRGLRVTAALAEIKAAVLEEAAPRAPKAVKAGGAAPAGGAAAGARAGAAPGPAAAAAGATTVRVFPVGEWSDVAVTRHQARRLAREHGVAPLRAGEVAIVVSELASNIVKYGVRGEIALHVAGSAERGMALTVVARDVGPPIHDLECALRDGCDDHGPIDPAALVQRGGLGTGLGAVARLADSLEVRQEAGGKQITATFSRGLTPPA